MLCSASDDRVVLGDEHDDYVWIDPAAYGDFDIIENEREVFRTYLEGTKP